MSKASTALAIAIALTLAACDGPGPCTEGCEDGRDFWETCMDEEGMLCDGSMWVDCVDDVERWDACREVGWEGDDCEFQRLEDEGVVHGCRDPDDAVEGCLSNWKDRFRAYDAEEKADAREECLQEDDLDQAIADADCAAFCEFFGI